MNRKLGIYISCIALLQVTLYAAAYVEPEATWLFYFDPRIGLFLLESSFWRSSMPMFPAASSIVSALILACVGAGLLLDKVSVGWYVIAETIMATPSVLFFAWIMIANLSPAHGFSVGELLFPIVVFSITSAVPIWFAIVALRSKMTK